jgi:hypothetical protein
MLFFMTDLPNQSGYYTHRKHFQRKKIQIQRDSAIDRGGGLEQTSAMEIHTYI